MQRIAAIDVGSNGIRMAVASVDSEAEMNVIESLRVPVRLGQDVFSSGLIAEASMQAALDAFLRFNRLAGQFQVTKLRAVATSALREAENRETLIGEIRDKTGIEVETISPEEEARLIHLAVSRVIDLRDKRAILIDVGGGSIEVAISQNNRLISAESFALGTVRLLRRLDSTEGSRSLQYLVQEYAESARRQVRRRIGTQKFDLCIGTGGNLEELGLLRRKVLGRASGRSISLSELADISERVSQMSLDDRMQELNLRPDRADVIVPAAMVLHMIVKEAGIKEIEIPGVGLKEGVLWEMAPLTLQGRLPRREQIWLSATGLGQKYQFDGEHGARVARMARRIFDQTASLHELKQEHRILLEAASLLHDIGHFVNMLGHEKHGAYIVRNSPLVGLDPAGREVVAQLVAFHRKLPPSTQDEDFKRLGAKDRQVVLKLCALLRLADATQISHTARVHNVTIREAEDCWQLHLHGEGEFLLEKWNLEKRKALFEDVFGVGLKVMP
ncbi:MAG TPA: Ppx/GppA phosphatase family protein [Anaerolineales bacterium]